MHSSVIRGPGELIATIPDLLGYWPQESVVAVGIDARGGIALLVRVHRDELLLADLDGGAAAAIADQSRRADVARAILVSFTTKGVTWGCEAAEVLGEALLRVAIDSDAWACDGRRFWAPGCADDSCCPPGGTMLPEPVPVPDRLGLGDSCARLERLYGSPCRKAPADLRRRASGAGDRWWARRRDGAEEWRVQSLQRLLRGAMDGASVLDLGRAAVSLRDVKVRDAVIVAWLRGGPHAISDTLAGLPTDDVARVLDGALHDVTHAAPALDDIETAVRWCRAVSSLARRRDCPATHALEAVVMWWAGDVDRAAAASTTALECDPQYSLARLMTDMCDRGLLPAWTRA
ncbi:DUF4192 family protein [Demequina sp. NBRC 110056]|uniref:DUF4192 family protein n=1 Tax=Demequina sp. NBRC 110056 TaxID=1570345 RepID=UPI0013564641|nr:DUF4192 family protein [Demequina sp. NBRC 110056]